MILQFNPDEIKSDTLGISLKDLLDDRGGNKLTDYVSVSISKLDNESKIKIIMTTTDIQPISYIAVIPVLSCIDLRSLVFVMQKSEKTRQ